MEATGTGKVTTPPVSGSWEFESRSQLMQVLLTPTTASLPVGGTVQFAASGRRKNGDSVTVTVMYSATGGTISAAGLFTAGQTAGSYRVITTQNGGTLARTAAVTPRKGP